MLDNTYNFSQYCNNKKPLTHRGERLILHGATLINYQFGNHLIQVRFHYFETIPWALITVPSPSTLTWGPPFQLEAPESIQPLR